MTFRERMNAKLQERMGQSAGELTKVFKELKSDMKKLQDDIRIVQKNQVEFEQYLQRIDKNAKETRDCVKGCK